uniref:BHLH domain-containing protein n=1 Tax=Sander lucioperca TaxID=283035 RepID=A0A8D0DDW1_SANLU
CNHCPPGNDSLQHTAAPHPLFLLMTLFFFLQKPLVEKLRRERINSSIEQLKSLLSPEFLKQQPDSKLEKADILEMTVCVLRRLQQQNQPVDSAAVGLGYSRCVQEVTHFLSNEQVKTQSQRRLLNHINKLQSSSDNNLREADFSLLSSTVQTSITKEKSPVNSAVWRPW